MPSATLDQIALRSANPVKRAMDVLCIIVLQLLTLMVVASDPDPERRRIHPFNGPDTILARFEAGETFDLPPRLLALLRALVRQLRASLCPAGVASTQPSAPIAAPRPTRATRPNAAAPDHVRAQPILQPRIAPPQPYHPLSRAPPSFLQTPVFQQKDVFIRRIAVPISLRYRNIHGRVSRFASNLSPRNVPTCLYDHATCGVALWPCRSSFSPPANSVMRREARKRRMQKRWPVAHIDD